MDPFSVSTVCVGLLAAVTQLSIQIRSFVSGVREARRDMDAVSRELTSLSLCLETLRDDSDKIKYPAGVEQNLIAVLKNCDLVAKDMLALLTKMSAGGLGSRIRWNTDGRDDMNKMRSSLEVHKSALDIALDMTSLMIMSAVKEDTEQIRNGTNEIKADTARISEIKQDTSSLIQELGLLRLQVTELQQHDSRGGILLQRFLEESTSYAETVVDIREFDESRTEMPPDPDPGGDALSDLSRSPPSSVVERDDEEVIDDVQAAEQSQNVRSTIRSPPPDSRPTEPCPTEETGDRLEPQEPDITDGLISPHLGARRRRPSWTEPASIGAGAIANTQVLGEVKDTVSASTINDQRKIPSFSLRRHGMHQNAPAEAAATSEPVTHALKLPISAARTHSGPGNVKNDTRAQSDWAADSAQPTTRNRQGESVDSNDKTLPVAPQKTHEGVSNSSFLAAPKTNSNTIRSSSPRQPSPRTVVKSPSKVPPWPTKFPDQNEIHAAAQKRYRLTREAKTSLDKRLEILIRGKKSLGDRLTGGAWFGDPVGTFAEIKQALRQGASMKFTREDALECELKHSCRFEVLELLLSFGANVNDQPSLVREIRSRGDHAVLQLLLEYGADPNLPKQFTLRGSPLELAVSLGRFELVKLLLDHKADANFVSYHTFCGTALNEACYHGNPDIVKVLLEHGADPNLKAGQIPKSPTQVTTYKWGGKYPSKAILTLLKEHGAEDPQLDEYLQRCASSPDGP